MSSAVNHGRSYTPVPNPKSAPQSSDSTLYSQQPTPQSPPSSSLHHPNNMSSSSRGPRAHRSPSNHQNHGGYIPMNHIRSSSDQRGGPNGQGGIVQDVATGNIGGAYGPYSYNPANQLQPTSNGRFAAPPESRVAGSATSAISESSYVVTDAGIGPAEKSNGAAGAIASGSTTATTTYLWDKDPDMDDPLHNFDPVRDRDLESIDFFSLRGWINASALFVILGGILMLFAGYPVYDAVKNKLQYTHESSVETSLPDMGLPTLVDSATPDSAKTRTGSDGKTYNLVFSDEFEVDGRTFYPGDDPYWEGVDLYYWPTGDLEWYDPGAMTTKNGKLQITITEELTHNLNFKSGMLQSWNKICFLTGYLEVSISMPGTPKAPGFWPGAWTMANLGRAGYGATTDGMWPYTYDSCDLGTFPNQTTKDLEPAAALTGSEYGGAISYLPGQKLSACTCPDSDHPGPSNGTNGYVGRGVPEVDILEAQVDVASGWRGEVSQSLQIAPFDLKYEFVNSTPATTISNDTISFFNSYKGDEWQEACSVVSYITDEVYNDTAYATYGYEWWSDPDNRDDGYIAWYSMGTETWKATAATIGPNNKSEVSQRLIPEEPMYVILNLGMAPSFEKQDFKHLQFPSTMYIDYVRIYQRDDVENGLTCDPTNRPTTQYIADHATAYNDANLTTWADAGYTFPRNWMYDGC